jgi:hypothetical protein
MSCIPFVTKVFSEEPKEREGVHFVSPTHQHRDRATVTGTCKGREKVQGQPINYRIESLCFGEIQSRKSNVDVSCAQRRKSMVGRELYVETMQSEVATVALSLVVAVVGTPKRKHPPPSRPWPCTRGEAGRRSGG